MATEAKHTPGPVDWQDMGGYKLVAQHGSRKIVLDHGYVGRPMRVMLRVRNEQDLMVAFNPAHPDARLIRAAYNSYDKHCGPRAVECAEEDLLGDLLTACEQTQKVFQYVDTAQKESGALELLSRIRDLLKKAKREKR